MPMQSTPYPARAMVSTAIRLLAIDMLISQPLVRRISLIQAARKHGFSFRLQVSSQ